MQSRFNSPSRGFSKQRRAYSFVAAMVDRVLELGGNMVVVVDVVVCKLLLRWRGNLENF
jgi:hypothetical protein